uniref:Uncharacterized protein n=1 Tax=Romanomermis culicivorax TaxID=13658 RepID=A0A915L6C2_ROMCU
MRRQHIVYFVDEEAIIDLSFPPFCHIIAVFILACVPMDHVTTTSLLTSSKAVIVETSITLSISFKNESVYSRVFRNSAKHKIPCYTLFDLFGISFAAVSTDEIKFLPIITTASVLLSPQFL